MPMNAAEATPRLFIHALAAKPRLLGGITRRRMVSLGIHDCSRGEYYYNIRFREPDARLVPILTTAIPNEKD